MEINKLQDNGDYVIKAWLDDCKLVYKMKLAIICQAYSHISSGEPFLIGDAKVIVDCVRGIKLEDLDPNNYPYSDKGLGWKYEEKVRVDITESKGELYLVLHNIKEVK